MSVIGSRDLHYSAVRALPRIASFFTGTVLNTRLFCTRKLSVIRKTSSAGSIVVHRFLVPMRQPLRSSLPYSTLPGNNEGHPSTQSPRTMGERLKTFFRQYGKLGLGIYLGVSLFSFSSIYLALRTGVDVKSFLQQFGLESKVWDNAGMVAIAYAIHKILMPLRIFISIGLTTLVAKKTRFGRRLTARNTFPGTDQNRN